MPVILGQNWAHPYLGQLWSVSLTTLCTGGGPEKVPWASPPHQTTSWDASGEGTGNRWGGVENTWWPGPAPSLHLCHLCSQPQQRRLTRVFSQMHADLALFFSCLLHLAKHSKLLTILYFWKTKQKQNLKHTCTLGSLFGEISWVQSPEPLGLQGGGDTASVSIAHSNGDELIHFHYLALQTVFRKVNLKTFPPDTLPQCINKKATIKYFLFHMIFWNEQYLQTGKVKLS